MNLHFIYGTVGRFENIWGRSVIEGHSKLAPLSQSSDGSELTEFEVFISSHMNVHVPLIPTWNEQCIFHRIHKYILGGFLEIEKNGKGEKRLAFSALFTKEFTPPNSEIICGQNVGTKVVCGMILFFEKKTMLKI